MSAVLQEPTPLIRPMRPTDLASVMAVETTAYTHPWTEGILRDCLRVGYICRVSEMGDEIAGHAVMSVAIGEAHLLNLCVAPYWQGRGVGRRLLRRMLRIARERDADTMFLEVRASNHGVRSASDGSCRFWIRTYARTATASSSTATGPSSVR